MKKHSIKTAVSLEEVGHGKTVPKAGWLKEMWRKWPGDEPIEEFLAMLEGDAKRRARRARNKDAPKSGGRKR
jgi:hypothetical protein